MMQITSRDLAVILRGQYTLEANKFDNTYSNPRTFLVVSEMAGKVAYVMFPDNEAKRLAFFSYVIGVTNDYDV